MKDRIIFLILLVLAFSRTWAISANINKEYRYTLLTEDYDILTDNDLAAYTWGMPPRPFDGEESGGYNYWQCFPREHISMTLEDFGYSSEDIEWKDTLSDITLLASNKPGVFHEYTMRHIHPTSFYEKKFHLWRKLMKGEKYVCLAGSYGSIEKRTQDGNTQEIHYWTFDKIKTKKGCDSNFMGDCHRTYQQFLQEKKRYKS